MTGTTEGIARKVDDLSKEEVIGNIITAYTKASENPLVDIIAHPFNTGRYFDIPVEPKEYPLNNLKKMAEAMLKNNTYFEIMNNIWWWFPEIHPKEFTKQYLKLVKVFACAGVKFSLGSDAHSIGGVGNLIWSKYIVKEADIENRLINPKIFIND